MNWFSVGAALLGLGVYAFTAWRFRGSTGPNQKVVEGNLAAGFLVFTALTVAGMAYPPVDRSGSSIIGATPGVLWASFLSAVPLGILLGMALHRASYPGAGGLTVLLIPVVGIFNVGVLLLVNATLDFTPPQRHVVQVVSKRFTPRRHKTSPIHLLVVSDWARNGRVRLKTGSSLYERAAVGTRLEVEVGSGLLGFEWVRGVRLF